ncbi:class F sortase [Lentzea sp. BCCO 10_0798]|uniref:Class F sortase n=1 Tax=Lentzea kristufekii TaxID=3095430 RepID=A0ABU4TV63_9PSEU|nr:class F sortase [Lentzea sp. BCCO 10_0798]MDX8051929.1 class F sortase [Lentzea sp. BCCO 10_0798]
MRPFWVLFAALVLLAGCARASDVTLPTAPVPTRQTSTESSVVDRGLPPSEPTEVRIPKIGAKSSLVPLGLNPDETIEVPPVGQPMQAGWYRLARTPGEAGPAVILGHVDGDKQPGIFLRLKELTEGDEVEVSRKDGTTARFRVRATEQIAKSSFPTEAVYGDTGEPELRLITCGGGYDQAARSYRDNIIVYATLI